MASTVLIKLDSKDPDLSKIREVVRAAREGKVVAFPTETVYGIGGPMSAPGISQSLDRIKNREAGKQYTFHIGSLDMLDHLKVKKTPAFKFLTRLFWPGPLTLIAMNQSGEKIGLRFPKSRLTTALINASGEPFFGTSANLSGGPSPVAVNEVMSVLGGQVDYVIDGGKTEYAKESTIVDITGEVPVVIRKGAESDAIDAAVEKVKAGKFPRKRVLFVCTGNSCRSPMAEGWLRDELKHKGFHEQIEVVSCGVGAREGATATPEAVLVMQNREIDISKHQSKLCTRTDIEDADIVFCMSHEHYVFITGLYPAAKDKIIVLGVPDPIGMGMLIYEEVIKSIEKKTKDFWQKIIA